MSSFVELSNRLSQLHLENTQNEPVLGLTAENRLKRLNHLKACLFNSLYTQLSGPLQINPVEKQTQSLTVWDKLHIHCADKRLAGQHDVAERLDCAVQRLSALDSSRRDDIEQVLILFEMLSGSGMVKSRPYLGHEELNLPTRGYSPKRKRINTSGGPLRPMKSDCAAENNEEYSIYPSSEWLRGWHSSTVDGLSRSTSWGTDLKKLIMNPADRDYVVPRNLFGAMVQSSISSVHTKLSLPELPSATSNNELLGLRLPAAMSSPDEGFGSMTSSRSSSVISSPTEKHPWTAALNFTVCKHRTWEILGQPGHKTERPYLTESGPGVFDQIYDVRCNQARMVANEYPVQVTIFKDEKQPCRDAIYALLGLPSETFQFDKKLLTFSSNRNCRLTGTSVESFQSMIQFFTDAATDYVRLQYITQPQFMDSFYHNGLVLQAFLGSVRKFLNFYQISVMKAVSDDNSALTLLKMRVVFSKLVSLLRTLASICGCDERQGTRPGDGGDQLCTGIKLISYLYRSCLDCISREEYLILLSLLRDACGPYLMFIQDWSFHGICGDLYQEFMIEVDNEHIYKRDKYYWTHGYKLRALEDQARVPFFMGSIATDIFNCGKSINLMKLCCPEHFICNVDMAVPRIIITFSSKELEESHFKTAEYSKQMTILSRQKTISRKQKAASGEKAKEENAIRAHRQAAKEMERIQNNILKVRLEADAKKRKIFQELKEQMQQELLRKASEDEAEKKEDKARMDALTGQEEDETDLQTELEIKAREELIAYYEELSEDARKRERRALWKVRRRNLDQSRKEFLATEEDRLDLEQTEKLANSERQVNDNEEFSRLETGANSHLDKADSLSKLKINTSTEPVTFVPVHEQNYSGESQPITFDVGHIGGSSKVGRESDVGHIRDNIKVSEDGDRKQLNPTNVTFLDNEDIESTLNLIGSEDSSLLHGGQTMTDVPVDIRDFMPKERREEDEEDEERAKDTSVEDVLLEIGCVFDSSNVPSKPEDDTVVPSVGTNGVGKPGNQHTVGISYNDDSRRGKPGNQHTVGITYNDDSRRAEVRMVKSESADSGIGKSTFSIPKHISDSSIKDLIYSTPLMKKDLSKSEPEVTVQTEPTRLQGHSSDSSLQNTLYHGMHENTSQRGHTSGIKTQSTTHPSDSTAQSLMYPEGSQVVLSALQGSQSDVPAIQGSQPDVPAIQGSHPDVPAIQGSQPAVPAIQGSKSDVPAATHISKAHPSDSTLQNVIYSTKLQKTDQYDKPFQLNAGHPSDSRAQLLLYGAGQPRVRKSPEVPEDKEEEIINEEMLTKWTEEMQPISFDFSVFKTDPAVDILAATGYIVSRSEVGDYCVQRLSDGNIDALDGLALPVLLQRSITAPLTAQVKIVNESILDYFHVELNIGSHFQNLRRYLFLEGGEFGQCLCDEMFDKLSSVVHLHELLSPIFLNQTLSRAVDYSSSGSDNINSMLSFVCKFIPKVFKPNAIDILDCLELKYKVDWPSNIVITDACLAVYNRIFLFLFKLKRTAWVLRDIHHQLDRCAKIQNAASSHQYHQLQLFRHEMQHFVSVMQSYVVNQVIHVSWEEFKQNLKQNVHNLDDLRSQHARYLDSAMHRCLLNKKASPVMKVITDILSLVLKVRSQLMSERWRETMNGESYHPNFANMKKSYAAFKDYSQFLFKVVTKLVTRGYQPHLEEFLMLLNFNDYYKNSS